MSTDRTGVKVSKCMRFSRGLFSNTKKQNKKFKNQNPIRMTRSLGSQQDKFTIQDSPCFSFPPFASIGHTKPISTIMSWIPEFLLSLAELKEKMPCPVWSSMVKHNFKMIDVVWDEINNCLICITLAIRVLSDPPCVSCMMTYLVWIPLWWSISPRSLP